MSQGTEDARAARSGKRTGHVTIVLGVLTAVAAVLAGTVGARWASEPSRRTRFLLDVPLALEPGAHAEGTFLPEHEGDHGLDLEIAWDGPVDGIAQWIQGGWFGREGQDGLHVRFAAWQDGRVLAQGTPENLRGGSRGQESVGISVLVLHDLAVRPCRVRLEVLAAPAPLAAVKARLVAGPGGDWINYAWLDSLVRGALLALGVGLLGLACLVSCLVHLWRHRRSARVEANTPPETS